MSAAPAGTTIRNEREKQATHPDAVIEFDNGGAPVRGWYLVVHGTPLEETEFEVAAGEDMFRPRIDGDSITIKGISLTPKGQS